MPKITNIPRCPYNAGVECPTGCVGSTRCGWHPETAAIRKTEVRRKISEALARPFQYQIPSIRGKCKLTYVTRYGIRMVELRHTVNMTDILALAVQGNTNIRFEYKGV